MTETRNQKSEIRNRKRQPSGFWFLVFVLWFLVSSCGFSPIYSTHDEEKDSTNNAIGAIAIANIPDRQGQLLRNHLMDRLYSSGRLSHTDATLEVSLSSSQTDLGIQKDATTARRQLNMWADYVLRDNSGHQLLKGRAHSVVSYSKLRAQYGTVAAEQNAIERAVKEVGEQIVNRLSLYYSEKLRRSREL